MPFVGGPLADGILVVRIKRTVRVGSGLPADRVRPIAREEYSENPMRVTASPGYFADCSLNASQGA
jgi:hypothetical protein